jgi:hypothetical protein
LGYVARSPKHPTKEARGVLPSMTIDKSMYQTQSGMANKTKLASPSFRTLPGILEGHNHFIAQVQVGQRQ